MFNVKCNMGYNLPSMIFGGYLGFWWQFCLIGQMENLVSFKKKYFLNFLPSIFRVSEMYVADPTEIQERISVEIDITILKMDCECKFFATTVVFIPYVWSTITTTVFVIRFPNDTLLSSLRWSLVRYTHDIIQWTIFSITWELTEQISGNLGAKSDRESRVTRNPRHPVIDSLILIIWIVDIGLDIQDDLGRHEVGFVENVDRQPANNGAGCRFKTKFNVNKVWFCFLCFLTVIYFLDWTIVQLWDNWQEIWAFLNLTHPTALLNFVPKCTIFMSCLLATLVERFSDLLFFHRSLLSLWMVNFRPF